MTAPVADARVYADFAGLDALKKSAHNNDPAALRQVAKQVESLFARMMIKSMRDASGTDPIFGSDQEKTYQGMYDDQLSIELTKGKGLGLADMLVQQMQRMAGKDKDVAAGDAAQAADAPNAAVAAGAGRSRAATALQSGAARQAAAPQPPTASSATRSSFIRDLWPQAEQAAKQLGVDARNLIAQAALETGWGTRMPQDAQGRSSNNLFGVKATATWTGASVTAGTQEYHSGTAVSTTGQFRAYPSRAQSFQDYVALLRNNPRFAAALNTGGDAHAFATALQRGGYATDPGYARKISAIAANLPATMPSAGVQPLKIASIRPIDTDTGTL